MSYSNPIVESTYTGDGLVDNFNVLFDYLEGESSVIVVELWDYTDPNLPVQLPYVLNVDYTIDESGFPATEINTTVPPTAVQKLILYRSTPTIQPASFVNGAFPAEGVEEGLDKAMFANQETEAVLDRALVNPVGGPAITIADVQANVAGVAQNTADIATNAANISSNDADIAINIGNIASNSTNIGTNTGNIATNTGNIATNTGNIATNTGDIATNAADIAALSAPTLEILVPVAVGGAYAASAKEIVLIQADNVTVNLPAPVLSAQVKVKMDGLRASAIINTGALIDGAASYSLLSSYESVSLVSDGTNWYII